MVGIVCILAYGIPPVMWMSGVALVAGLLALIIPVTLLVCYAGLAAAGGIGLVRDMEWGRALSIVHSAITLLWIPIGTVIGILALVYLTRNEVREYFQASDGR